MEFELAPAPHSPQRTSVAQVMREVVFALIPAVLVHMWYFGPGLLLNIVLATVVALGSEALALRLRDRPVRTFVTDWSVIVTAILIAFALPPLTPWWVTTIAALFAVLIAKHAYGGLGFNPFNPAMAGYAVVLLSFPFALNVWTAARGAELGTAVPDLMLTLRYLFTGQFPAGVAIDALTAATPLDLVQTQLEQARMMSEIRAEAGALSGSSWMMINLAVLAGGGWMLFRGIIRWHIPVGVLAGLAVPALLAQMLSPDTNAPLSLHMLSGATMLGAFFIATDPVSAATSPRGRLVYGAGIGLLTWMIRTWGSYPDGVAFAVLLMNAAVPVIDRFTRPRVYGHAG